MRPRVTEEILRARLAKNVRTRREAAALTLEKAAKRAEMHLRHWQRIEAGDLNTTLHTLVRLGDALDVDPGVLLAPEGTDRTSRQE